MKWVDLKIHLAPLFTQQINEVSQIYMSKYYNFEINLYIEEENNKNLKLLETTSIGIGGSRKYKMNLICNKDMSQVNKVFIPLI